MSETRLYRWQWTFSANDELGVDEASALYSFVRAHLANGKVERAETVKPPDKIELVVYYDQSPSGALIAQHQARYGRTPLAISLPHTREGAYLITDVYEYDRDGVMEGRLRTMLDDDQNPQREWRYDRRNELYEIVEYEVDMNGELVVRSRAPDGKLIHEDRPPLSD
jgi:hypothetical protein